MEIHWLIKVRSSGRGEAGRPFLLPLLNIPAEAEPSPTRRLSGRDWMRSFPFAAIKAASPPDVVSGVLPLMLTQANAQI